MAALTEIFTSNYGWKIFAIISIIYAVYKFLERRKQIFIAFKNTEFYCHFLTWKLALKVVLSRFDSLPIVEMLNHVYEKGYFAFNFIVIKYMILFSPDHIQVLLSDSECINKSILYNGFKNWIEDSVFMRNDGAHRERKKLLLPAFRLNVLHSFLPIIENNARELVKVLKENEKVFIVPAIKHCGFNILYDTVLGTKGDSIFRKSSSYHAKLIDATFHPVADRAINLLLLFDFLFYLTPKGRKFRKNKRILRKITRQMIAEKIKLREGEESGMENNENPKSILDFLLDARDNNPELTVESICEEIEFFLGAAYDTTSLTVSWTLYLLSQNEDIQKKVHEELDAIFGTDTDRSITNEDLYEMKYMECVIKETMRLYSPAPIISRKVNKSIVFGDKVYSKDWIFVVSIFHLHRNPNVYENPNIFDPDRFLPENSSKRKPYSYIPFSAGPRMCLGYRLAMMEIKLILATILRNSKVECGDETISLYFRITLNPSRPLQLKFKPRKT
ncbi:cytochrome P450 4C1-like [Centruroides sculpturatus]|uniref:cytochrome P450 4C1-like n=1 Tax=Centruroides sculpturatus TaxID=218467 RepID=UPI000C6E412C|nr:cytochrome P450 4C1-like [Centruroides sculpturatus]